MSLLKPAFNALIRNFRPGYLDAPDTDFIPLGATAEAKNCLFTSPTQASGMSQLGIPVSSERTSLSKRTGCVMINPTAVAGGSRWDSLYEFRREGVSAGQLIGTANGHLFLWDGATIFTDAGAAGFTGGNPTHWATFKNLAIGCDGAAIVAWDGAAFFTPGLAAPGAEGGLADGGAGGALPAGTWEAVQTWYDSTHDHDSNISGLSAQLVLAGARLRQHTRPAAPPATATHWRTWVRRVDINETYYRLVATTIVATLVFTESVSDDARRLALIAPLPNQNTAPPVFAFTRPFQGYLLGVIPNTSTVYPSRPNDPQSFNPLEAISVGAGDGQELRGITLYGERCLAQKARKTWELQGDRMPFIPKEVDGSLGAVSFECSVEAADGYLYSWDQEEGPYRTNLATWQSLSDGRIATLVASVNRGAATEIKAVEVKALNTVFWSIATVASTRMRTVIGYNYALASWLPPITGLEVSALTTFLTTANATNLYVGDYWGRVYQFFSGNRDGVPSGSLIARVSAAAAGTVTADFEQTLNADGSLTTTAAPVAFYTTGSKLAGLLVGVVDNFGNWQIRRISTNTGSQITLDTINDSDWATIPQPGGGRTYTVVVGLIEWFWTTGIIDDGDPMLKKRGGFGYIQARGKTAVFLLSVGLRFDGQTAASRTVSVQTPTSSAWGQLWGVMLWGAGQVGGKKFRIARSYNRIQAQVFNYWPDQGVDILSIGLAADPLPRRQEASSAL